jgi:cell division septum initiation protein DivIVA
MLTDREEAKIQQRLELIEFCDKLIIAKDIQALLTEVKRLREENVELRKDARTWVAKGIELATTTPEQLEREFQEFDGEAAPMSSEEIDRIVNYATRNS